jgi:Arc/MetJ family transcription regulator
MMDELIAAVARAARLSPEQATLAVGAVLRFFTARLPSSLVGELHARLQPDAPGTQAPARQTAAGHAPEWTP